MAVGQHQTCGGCVQQVDAAEHQHVQEVEHVELVDQRVRQRDERLDDEAFPVLGHLQVDLLRAFTSLTELTRRSSLDPDAPSHHVGCDIGQSPVIREHVGGQTQDAPKGTAPGEGPPSSDTFRGHAARPRPPRA